MNKREFNAVILALSLGLWLVWAGCVPVSAEDGMPKSIPFSFSNPIDDYEVTGVWFPETIEDGAIGLQGSATFNFHNIKNGNSTTITANGISLIDDDFWKSKGIDNVHEFFENPQTVIDKLLAAGPLTVSLDGGSRATVVNCPESQDQCIKFGKAIIDLQDVDFDGKKELIINHVGAGQRGVNRYEIHPLDPMTAGGLRLADSYGPYEPLNLIDDMTEIDISRRQISVIASGGACGSWIDTYALTKSDNLTMRIVHHVEWKTDASGNKCYQYEYSVDQSDTGVRKYRMLSRKLIK